MIAFKTITENIPKKDVFVKGDKTMKYDCLLLVGYILCSDGVFDAEPVQGCSSNHEVASNTEKLRYSI